MSHWPRGVLHEDAFPLKLHEEFAAGQVLQDQIELVASLEGVQQVHQERVLQQGKAMHVTTHYRLSELTTLWLDKMVSLTTCATHLGKGHWDIMSDKH